MKANMALDDADKADLSTLARIAGMTVDDYTAQIIRHHVACERKRATAMFVKRETKIPRSPEGARGLVR